KGKRPAAGRQPEVQHEVFAEVQPFRVAADPLERAAPVGNRPAGRHELLRVDVPEFGQDGCAHRYLKGRAGVRQEEPGNDLHPGVGLKRRNEALQPARVQPDAGVGTGDHVVGGGGNRDVAALGDVRAGPHDDAQRQAVGIRLYRLDGVVGGAAIADDNLIRLAGLGDDGVHQPADGLTFVEYGGNE